MTSKEFEEQVKIAKNIAVKANDMSLIDGVFLKGFFTRFRGINGNF